MWDVRERRLNALLVGVGLLLVCLGVVGASRLTGLGPFADRSFCGKYEEGLSAWQAFRGSDARAAGRDGVNDRQHLADEIDDCGTLDGQSRGWVEARLGRGSVWTGRERGRVTYTLGLCTNKRDCFFPGDTEFLDVYYDDEETVDRVDIYST